ncbi:MAG: type IV-A pilus assembly ATPase PilB [Gammaproteobacteria bacterium]|nr:type IV-A pilus assembly ATPase PilB [Gammaproteobacteria bacterium]
MSALTATMGREPTQAAERHRRATEGVFDMPRVDLDAFDLAGVPAHLINEDLVRRHTALPLVKRGTRLFVAIADADNREALKAFAAATGLETEPVLVEQTKLAAAVNDYRSAGDETLLKELESHDDAESARRHPGDDDVELTDETPVVRYIHQTLLEAVESGASDIHFEPYEEFYRVRMRIDGILREARRPPARLGRRFAARLKVMGKLDVTERRMPQDGRLQLSAGQRVVDFRINTLPTMHGEKVALRILDSAAANLGIDDLGFEADQNRLYREALGRPQGMVLVTGPTGSGKTVTVYAGLNRLNAEHRNIATVEDPVEINVDGINQVQVNARIGFDFASALRAFLRQDPDVVMVGEMRDLETAETAIKAAQTGHLVLSTLHTNSAPETLTRLRTMGVPAYNLATSVTLIVAQRLARLLCPQCRRPLHLPDDALVAEGFDASQIDRGLQLYDANDAGCGDCDHGYKGRTGIYEVVPLEAELQRLILAERDSLALAETAQALGYDNVRRAGLRKVASGLTSLREVNRVMTTR